MSILFINLANNLKKKVSEKERKKEEKMKRKGQVSIEYLIIVGFVTFVVMSIIGIAFYYSGTMKGKIKENQVTEFANKLILTSESVYYSGEPSKATINVYLPEGVSEIRIESNELVIQYGTSSGENIISFSSKVPVEENSTAQISQSQGLKKIEIKAQSDKVIISQV